MAANREDTMKFMLFVLPTVPATLEEREQLRPIGRNNDRYQMMLEELRRLAVFADDAGFDVMSTTEHHFHSEGYECSVAPLMLYTDLAARTKRIRFSPLGLVLPTWDPIRCAEELAVLDHLTKGRIYAGFARGYQDRWVNVLGQQYHVTGAPMDGSSIDNHNRRVYEETLKVIKKAWTRNPSSTTVNTTRCLIRMAKASRAGRSRIGHASTGRRVRWMPMEWCAASVLFPSLTSNRILSSSNHSRSARTRSAIRRSQI
jgi:alkanesulfonate monooxygenase SsuD/methylene tetrahydromethanopterin reductase-like flavin-dependent oxidoreductase (luciferase family)